MTFHKGTPTFISYSLQNTPLNRICSGKNVGVLLDPKLKFDCHCQQSHELSLLYKALIKRI